MYNQYNNNMLTNRIVHNKLVLTTFTKQNYPNYFPHEVIMIIIKMLHDICQPYTMNILCEDYLKKHFNIKWSERGKLFVFKNHRWILYEKLCIAHERTFK